MALTKKDYVAIAATIRHEYRVEDEAGRLAIRRVTLALASVFATENPRFDRDRFLNAAYRNMDDIIAIIESPEFAALVA